MEVSDGSEAKHEKEERAKMDSYVEMLFTSIRSDNYEQKRSQAHRTKLLLVIKASYLTFKG